MSPSYCHGFIELTGGAELTKVRTPIAGRYVLDGVRSCPFLLPTTALLYPRSVNNYSPKFVGGSRD